CCRRHAHLPDSASLPPDPPFATHRTARRMYAPDRRDAKRGARSSESVFRLPGEWLCADFRPRRGRTSTRSVVHWPDDSPDARSRHRRGRAPRPQARPTYTWRLGSLGPDQTTAPRPEGLPTLREGDNPGDGDGTRLAKRGRHTPA